MTDKATSQSACACAILIIAIAVLFQIRMLLVEELASIRSIRPVRTAIRIDPGYAEAYISLANLEPADRSHLLQKAVSLDARDAKTMLTLASLEEVDGQVDLARKHLLEAASIDAQSETSWALLNFYARQNNHEEFVSWSKRYLRVSSDSAQSLFLLAWSQDADVNRLLEELGPLSCSQTLDLADMLTSQNALLDATPVEDKLASCPSPQAVKAVSLYIRALLMLDQPQIAQTTWKELRRNPLSQGGAGNEDLLVNADFHLPLSEEGFNWTANLTPGVDLTMRGSPRVLNLALSGEQPRTAILLFHPVALAPGSELQFGYTFQGTDDQPDADFEWQLLELKTGKAVATAADQPGASGNKHLWHFTVPASAHSLALALIYSQSLGHSRYRGDITLADITLRAMNSPHAGSNEP